MRNGGLIEAGRCRHSSAAVWMGLLIWALAVGAGAIGLAENPAGRPAAERGYRFLLDKAYVPPYFDTETIENSWRAWPPAERARAEKASATERLKMIYRRYGLTPRPLDASSLPEDENKPLQFVVDDAGNWSPNCFTCHGGSLLGTPYPGLPNNRYALQTMIQETRLTKIRLGKPLMPIDLGAFVIPLGTTVGTTNAVIFGVALAGDRDPDLNVRPGPPKEPFVHHDMEAPPWWHFRRKDRLYLDGFAEKGHRPLMQFALDRTNGPERFREWEDDFRDIFAYLESIEPPAYPFAVDRTLAAAGERVFNRVCAECHGTYGANSDYPERVIPIEEIGTDRARFDSLQEHHRISYAENWFSHYGEDSVMLNPGGYVAPPLDGVWASAPYFHNGSVPTLWHVLHPAQRPRVWRRNSDEYDPDLVGLPVEIFEKMPPVRGAAIRREYFDTTRFGKSAEGHNFPDALDASEKRAVLEYLKTL